MSMLHPLLWPVLGLLMVTASPAEEPPSPAALDLSNMPAATILAVDHSDVLTVRQGSINMQVRLANLSVPSDNPQAQQAARDFLRNLLAGEKVWMIQTTAAPNPQAVRWYVYRWPDKLFVNLELVRQGYADMAPEPSGPAVTAKVLVYWRDQAKQSGKGIWGKGEAKPAVARAPASRPQQAKSAGAGPAAGDASVTDAATIVYVSASGKKYHRANCGTLRKGGNPVPLDEARKSREACRTCNPPQ